MVTTWKKIGKKIKPKCDKISDDTKELPKYRNTFPHQGKKIQSIKPYAKE